MKASSVGTILLLILTWLPPSVASAQNASAPAAATRDTIANGVTLPAAAATDTSLALARELIKSGDYDRAIDVVTAAIQRLKSEPQMLRQAYLLLIKARVTYGNYLKSQPQGRAASQLSYEEARRTITECLKTPGLRHTQPEPASEYPPEVLQFFRDVRGKIFGAFRIVELTPPTALALLDADTLRVAPGDSLLGDVDLSVGSHVVALRAKGHRDVTDEITISPGATLERSYHLAKARTGRWYAMAAAGTAALVAGVVALAGSKGNGTTATESPLPGPPSPPSASSH